MIGFWNLPFWRVFILKNGFKTTRKRWYAYDDSYNVAYLGAGCFFLGLSFLFKRVVYLVNLKAIQSPIAPPRAEKSTDEIENSFAPQSAGMKLPKNNPTVTPTIIFFFVSI